MAQYFAGHSGDAIFGGVALKVREWSFTDEAAVLNTTGKGHGGYSHLITGVRKATGSATAVWDSDVDAYATEGSAGFIRSSACGTLVLKITDCDTIECHATFPEVHITSATWTSNVDGLLEINFSWEANGSYTITGECSALTHCDDLCSAEEGP